MPRRAPPAAPPPPSGPIKYGATERFLTFVQGHRHLEEYAVQGAMFSLSRSAWLVSHSDLLLHSNNPNLSRSALEAGLAAYPHKVKTLVRSDENVGRLCGHIEAIRHTRDLWANNYSAVLFCHPDVMLTPPAVELLSWQIASHPNTA
eukprot:3030696-Prymnesium_polylepis.2